MAEDKKPPRSSAGPPPIPAAKKDDVEDVSWALSTAEAMWHQGDRSDALKWLRRAAEAASEAEADDRALELAKAAADLAPLVDPRASFPPPPPSSAAPRVSTNAPPPSMPAPGATTASTLVSPGGGAPPRGTGASALRNVAAAPVRPSGPSAPSALKGPAVPSPSRLSAQHPLSAAVRQAPASSLGAVSPTSTLASAGATGRRGRRSSPNHDGRPAAQPGQHLIDDAATSSRAENTKPAAGARAPRQSATNEARRKNRASSPSHDRLATQPDSSSGEETHPSTVAAPPPEAPPPSSRRPSADEIDAWPTQTLEREELTGLTDEMTRIGTPAYREDAKSASSGEAPAPGMRPSQAMRVVVWRAADGVRVAPQGTHVSAITIDALLVALDPGADLAAWLAKK